MERNEKIRKMAETSWIARAHRVSEARVHGVPMARVHTVFYEQTNCSDPVVISKFLAKFKWWKGGDEDGGVDPLAKHQIRGPKQPNLTRSNKLQEKKLGYFCGDFRIWTKTTKSS